MVGTALRIIAVVVTASVASAGLVVRHSDTVASIAFSGKKDVYYAASREGLLQLNIAESSSLAHPVKGGAYAYYPFSVASAVKQPSALDVIVGRGYAVAIAPDNLVLWDVSGPEPKHVRDWNGSHLSWKSTVGCITGAFHESQDTFYICCATVIWQFKKQGSWGMLSSSAHKAGQCKSIQFSPKGIQPMNTIMVVGASSAHTYELFDSGGLDGTTVCVVDDPRISQTTTIGFAVWVNFSREAYVGTIGSPACYEDVHKCQDPSCSQADFVGSLSDGGVMIWSTALNLYQVMELTQTPTATLTPVASLPSDASYKDAEKTAFVPRGGRHMFLTFTWAGSFYIETFGDKQVLGLPPTPPRFDGCTTCSELGLRCHDASTMTCSPLLTPSLCESVADHEWCGFPAVCSVCTGSLTDPLCYRPASHACDLSAGTNACLQSGGTWCSGSPASLPDTDAPPTASPPDPTDTPPDPTASPLSSPKRSASPSIGFSPARPSTPEPAKDECYVVGSEACPKLLLRATRQAGPAACFGWCLFSDCQSWSWTSSDEGCRVCTEPELYVTGNTDAIGGVRDCHGATDAPATQGPTASPVAVLMTPAPAVTPAPLPTPVARPGETLQPVVKNIPVPPNDRSNTPPMMTATLGPVIAKAAELIVSGEIELTKREAAIRAISGVAAVSSAAVGTGGGSVTAAMRLVAASQICQTEPLPRSWPFVLHPTQWAPGGDSALGMVLGNGLITAGMGIGSLAGVHLMAAAVRMELMPQALVRLGVQEWLHFPSAALLVFQCLYQGLAIGGFVLVGRGTSSFSFTIGVVALCACAVGPLHVFMTVRLQAREHAEYVFDTDALSKMLRFVLGSGEWVDKCRDTSWVDKYSSVVRAYRPPVVWYSFIEFAASFALSGILAMQPKDQVGCGHGKVFSAVVFALLFFVEQYLRPHARYRDIFSGLFYQGIQTVAMILLALGYYLSEKYDEHWSFVAAAAAVTLAVSVLAAKSILDFGAEIYILVTARREKLQDSILSDAPGSGSDGGRNSNANRYEGEDVGSGSDSGSYTPFVGGCVSTNLLDPRCVPPTPLATPTYSSSHRSMLL